VSADDARALAAARRWSEAASAWEEVGRSLASATDPAEAQEAWAAAGECWRRDDRLDEARRCLETALGFPQPSAVRQQAQARLAAVLGELGEGRAAVDVLRDALTDASGASRAAVVDTLVGTLLGFGRLADVRPLVGELASLGGPANLAVCFRRGQVARLDGDLAAAVDQFETVRARLDGVDGAEAGVAAAEMELAEVAALAGRPADALDPFERGRALHLDAGRRALAFRCEAGRVRAAVQAGLQVVSPLLDQGLSLAVGRGLRLLALDLGLARGMARAATDPAGARGDLRQAVREADALGTRLRGGRARLELVNLDLAEGGERAELREQAIALLADHHILRRRAEALEP